MSNASDQKEISSLDQERMQDVQLLLDNLFRREETTVLMLLDCLYDIGATHLIEQKIPIRVGQQVVTIVVNPIKPLFKAIAIRWVKQNVPQLLTDWLYSKVSFEPDEGEDTNSDETAAIAAAESSALPSQTTSDGAALPSALSSPKMIQEVEQLQRQVRLLAGVSIVAIAALLGTLMM